MPLFNKKEIFRNYTAAVWHITESEEYFMEQLHLDPWGAKELEKIKGSKRKEWLSARMLLQVLSNGESRPIMFKDSNGKPHLKGDERKLSISHSYEFSAIGFSDRHIGIDIQKELVKIERIKNKFLHPAELNRLHEETLLAQLHFYWGAKESIYKAYGKKQLNFAKQIILEPFEIINKEIKTKGRLIFVDSEISFDIRGEQFNDYYLVYAIEI